MSSRRTLILIGAIVVGIFAGVALLNYVRGIEDDIAAEKQSVDVLVAGQDIPKGTSAAEAINMMVVAQIPLELRPNTFLPVESRDSILGLEAQNAIAKNQIIIDGLFVDPTVVQQKFNDQIPPGQVAMSLTIDQVAAVAGFVQPGDEVNLLVQHENLGCGGGEEDEEDGPGGEDLGDAPAPPTDGNSLQTLENEEYCTFTNPGRYLFQRLEVLSVGANLPLAPGESSTQGITQIGGPMTFMVPSEAAQLLASIDENDVILTLLPEDYQAEQMRALTFDLMEGPTPAEVAQCLTPYGPSGYIAGDAPDASDTVADGDDSTVEHFSCETLWEG